ncbi:hypothetical protein WN51_09792 [Melipona quadrifasciata]|uniref:Uncharacterized protein n=1 Tax=Melipona quadrifasciata TaxID=166423 RepID=A0A0N0BIC0_9HYME|nr:hypothetical protein WN51_09792 [Melipona quadrifasciata]
MEERKRGVGREGRLDRSFLSCLATIIIVIESVDHWGLYRVARNFYMPVL